MPAYNAGKYIGEAIKSILNQSYKNWELVIVNDGSTDDTLAAIETIKDDRIKVTTQENKGQCAAANKAFSLSTGTLIKFMDADDLISPDFIENQVKVLQGKNGAIATASWGRFYNDDLDTFKLVKNKIRRDTKPVEWFVESMQNEDVMLQCALWLIPRDILNRSGLWDEKLSLINDFEFFIRVLLYASQIIFTDNAILYYRSNVENSLSGTKSRKSAESAYNSINKGTLHLLSRENSVRIKKISANSFQQFVYEFYPSQPDLVNNAEKRIKDLGGSGVAFPAGGYTKIASKLIGWKLTKRIKSLF